MFSKDIFELSRAEIYSKRSILVQGVVNFNPLLLQRKSLSKATTKAAEDMDIIPDQKIMEEKVDDISEKLKGV